MIDPETLIRWTYELVAFVNGDVNPLFTPDDVDTADNLPDEPRTPEQVAALRRTATRALKALSLPSKQPTDPARLVRRAEEWLDDPLVRSTSDAYAYTPMDGAFSLNASGRLQLTPRFRSEDAKFAVTFAELIQADSPAFIKQCWCGKFLVRLASARGQPRKLCDKHFQESKQSKKRTTKK